MSDSEELSKLAALHQTGALSDDEFARAKARVLSRMGQADAGRSEAPAMDAINAMMGKDMVRMAVQRFDKRYKLRAAHLSQRYTNRLDEILNIQI